MDATQRFWSAVPIPVISAAVGGLLALLLFADYFLRRRRDVQTIAVAAPAAVAKQNPKPLPSRKPNPKSHNRPSSVDNKDGAKRHHPLDLNTLKGHGDSVSSLCFSSDGRCLATDAPSETRRESEFLDNMAFVSLIKILTLSNASWEEFKHTRILKLREGHNLAVDIALPVCADGVARIFKLDDVVSKSFRFLRVNLPAGGHPTAVAFSEGTSSFVVASQALSGSSMCMYQETVPKASDESKQGKLPLPEIKWEHSKVHGERAILTLSGAKATYGTANGSTIIVSCSEGTDIKIWHGKSGNVLKVVDTNQLKNNMAEISPNGRFLAAAAFTADVKVWEIIYAKDGTVKEVSNVMQLKGHKSAVTWLCFFPNSEQILTASKDGSIRIWNINVRYHLSEDPKTLKMFPIPLLDAKGSALQYDRLSISPNGKILAATHGSILQWLCTETGKVLDTADKAHEGTITSIAWSPQPIPTGEGVSTILATAGEDKKVKLWASPTIMSS